MRLPTPLEQRNHHP